MLLTLLLVPLFGFTLMFRSLLLGIITTILFYMILHAAITLINDLINDLINKGR